MATKKVYRVSEAGGGINKDLLPSELKDGQWSDGENYRFRNGFALPRAGMKAAYTAADVDSNFVETYIPSSGTRFIVVAGPDYVRADDGSTQTNITRYTDGKTISTITRVGTTATLTTSEVHGLSTGNTVTVYGATPSQYNGTYSITVGSTTTFTYTMASDPGASATVTTATGYSKDVENVFTGDIDDKWTGGAFNGIFVLNNPLDGMYYWSGDTSVRLRRMPGWLAGQKCDAIVFYKNYILALAPTIDGVKQPQTILWGSAAEPGALPASWTATSTNDAGDSPLPAETNGALVDGLTYGDLCYLFDQDACYGLQFIGGDAVFRVFRLPSVDGLFAARCAVRTPKGIVYLSNGDIRLHNGAESVSIAEGRVRDWFKTQLNPENGQRAFVVANPVYNEVWVCFPTYGQTYCDKALVWNWDADVWSVFTFTNTTLSAGCSGLITSGLSIGSWATDSDSWESDTSIWDQSENSPNEQRVVLVSGVGAVYLDGIGMLNSDQYFLERKGLALGDPDRLKAAFRVRPYVDGVAGATMVVVTGYHTTPDGTPTYGGNRGFTQGTTTWTNSVSNAAYYIAVKFQAPSNVLAMRSYDIEYANQGRF